MNVQKTNRHYRILQNYFKHEDLIRIIDGKGYMRLSTYSIFLKNADFETRSRISNNIESVYDYITQATVTSIDRFKRILAIASAFDCLNVKYMSTNDFFKTLHVYAGSRGSVYKPNSYYIVENAIAYFQSKNETLFDYKKPDKSVVTRMALDERLVKATSFDVERLMTIYNNSHEVLVRLNYDNETLPIKWHVPCPIMSNYLRQINEVADIILQKMLLRQLQIEDLNDLYVSQITSVLKQFVHIMRVQTAQFYIIDQTGVFNNQTNGLVLFHEDHEFDDLNRAVNQLHVLLSLINKYDVDTEFLYITPELIDIITPLCNIKVRKMVNTDIVNFTQKFRKGTISHVQNLQQFVSDYHSKKRRYYFIKLDTLKKVYDDFRLYNNHFAKYTSDYIESQSPEWRKAFGNINATIRLGNSEVKELKQ